MLTAQVWTPFVPRYATQEGPCGDMAIIGGGSYGRQLTTTCRRSHGYSSLFCVSIHRRTLEVLPVLAEVHSHREKHGVCMLQNSGASVTQVNTGGGMSVKHKHYVSCLIR